MTEFQSAQGVFDALQMFWNGSETVDTNDEDGTALLVLGTPSAGLAVRIVIPSGITLTASQIVTFTLTGLKVDGSTLEPTAPVYTKSFTKAEYDAGITETLIPFTFATDAPYVNLNMAQAEVANDFSGIVAGIVTDHKSVDWTREPGWNISKDVPA